MIDQTYIIDFWTQFLEKFFRRFFREEFNPREQWYPLKWPLNTIFVVCLLFKLNIKFKDILRRFFPPCYDFPFFNFDSPCPLVSGVTSNVKSIKSFPPLAILGMLTVDSLLNFFSSFDYFLLMMISYLDFTTTWYITDHVCLIQSIIGLIFVNNRKVLSKM